MTAVSSSIDHGLSEPIAVDDWLEQVHTVQADNDHTDDETLRRAAENPDPDTGDDWAADPVAHWEDGTPSDDDSGTEPLTVSEATAWTDTPADADLESPATADSEAHESDIDSDDPDPIAHPSADTRTQTQAVVDVLMAAAAALVEARAEAPIEADRLRRQRDRWSVMAAFAFGIFLVALGGGSGYGLAQYLPDRWTAEAEVVVDPGNDQVDRHLATQQVLMQSSTVLDRAVDELPEDRDYVEERLDVVPIESSNALLITFVDEDPERAKSVVAAVLGSFMVEVDVAATDLTRPIYEARIEELSQQREQLEKRLKMLERANAEAEAAELAQPYPGDVRRLSLESEQLLAQINGLEEALLVDEVAVTVRADAQVVTAPRILSEPTWPKPLAFTAFGLLVGSVVAAAVLFLLASRRAR